MAEAQAIPDQTGSGDKSAQIASQQPAPAAGGGDWSQAAQGAAQPTGSPAAAGKPAATPTTPGAAAGAPPAAPAPAQPTVITPQKRGGILGVMDSIADALTGKTRPEIGKDQDGNSYVKQVSLTHGEQWLRIAGEAIHGAAAGLAAGKGAGNMGKAALAGVEAGQQDQQQQQKQQKEMTEQARQQTLDNANNQLLRMQMAEHTYTAARLKVKASQEDEQFADKQEDRLKENGGILLGTTAHVGDISHLMAKNPQLMEDLVKNHALEFVPNYENGQVAGFKVYKTTPGYRATVLPDGAIFHTFDNTTGQYLEHKASGPITQGEIDDYNTAAGNAALKYKTDQVETGLKVVQTAEATARAKAAPAEAAKNQAEASKAYAEGRKADAEAREADALAGTGGAGNGLIDLIGTGKLGNPYILGRLSMKNPQILQQVAQKYPGFDLSKIGAYTKAYDEFVSTKTGSAGWALNAGETALQHLQQLIKLNTLKSHIYGTNDYTAYHNQLDTVAPELAKFYGDTTIPAIESIKTTLGSTLPGNRQAAIQTQGRSLGIKFDSYAQQWKNAAPSAAYEAQMPGLSENAIKALQTLDPQFDKTTLADIAGTRARLGANQPDPASHAWSASAWAAANPKGDVNAAKAAAQQQGYQVVE
jgi:hypothetical protein